jgi:POT family proton-dependent oligopeptide transporter
MLMSAPTTSGERQRTFFGQPMPLASLFGVELWERFSFYGMQGILLIYLYYSADRGGLGMNEATAASIVGAYGGLVYLSTILGAWLADRVLGPERTLFYSAAVVMLGHISLALLPGFAGVGVGLVLIAFGSGGVKANATSLVGTLYEPGDQRRDAGFSLFYMGINLGALVGPLLTGLLQSELGFHYGFGLAAIGMALGLLQYSFGRRGLPDEARTVPRPLPKSQVPKVIGIGVAVVVVVAGCAFAGLLPASRLATTVIVLAVAAAVVYFVVILSSKQIDQTERSRVFAFIPLFVASAIFWSLYQQQFTVVTIFSDKLLDRTVFGWEMPVSFVQSINPIFIIVLAGAAAAMWTKLGSRQPSTPMKFALGLIAMGLAFLLFLPMGGGQPNSAPFLGLVVILLAFTIAELLLSPVGLSLTTKLAPEAFRTQMVALFFLSVAVGTAMSGALTAFYDPDDQTAQLRYFGILGGIAILCGILLWTGRNAIKRLMAGVQ